MGFLLLVIFLYQNAAGHSISEPPSLKLKWHVVNIDPIRQKTDYLSGIISDSTYLPDHLKTTIQQAIEEYGESNALVVVSTGRKPPHFIDVCVSANYSLQPDAIRKYPVVFSGTDIVSQFNSAPIRPDCSSLVTDQGVSYPWLPEIKTDYSNEKSVYSVVLFEVVPLAEKSVSSGSTIAKRIPYSGGDNDFGYKGGPRSPPFFSPNSMLFQIDIWLQVYQQYSDFFESSQPDEVTVVPGDVDPSESESESEIVIQLTNESGEVSSCTLTPEFYRSLSEYESMSGDFWYRHLKGDREFSVIAGRLQSAGSCNQLPEATHRLLQSGLIQQITQPERYLQHRAVIMQRPREAGANNSKPSAVKATGNSLAASNSQKKRNHQSCRVNTPIKNASGSSSLESSPKAEVESLRNTQLSLPEGSNPVLVYQVSNGQNKLNIPLAKFSVAQVVGDTVSLEAKSSGSGGYLGITSAQGVDSVIHTRLLGAGVEAYTLKSEQQELKASLPLRGALLWLQIDEKKKAAVEFRVVNHGKKPMIYDQERRAVSITCSEEGVYRFEIEQSKWITIELDSGFVDVNSLDITIGNSVWSWRSNNIESRADSVSSGNMVLVFRGNSVQVDYPFALEGSTKLSTAIKSSMGGLLIEVDQKMLSTSELMKDALEEYGKYRAIDTQKYWVAVQNWSKKKQIDTLSPKIEDEREEDSFHTDPSEETPVYDLTKFLPQVSGLSSVESFKIIEADRRNELLKKFSTFYPKSRKGKGPNHCPILLTFQPQEQAFKAIVQAARKSVSLNRNCQAQDKLDEDIAHWLLTLRNPTEREYFPRCIDFEKKSTQSARRSFLAWSRIAFYQQVLPALDTQEWRQLITSQNDFLLEEITLQWLVDDKSWFSDNVRRRTSGSDSEGARFSFAALMLEEAGQDNISSAAKPVSEATPEIIEAMLAALHLCTLSLTEQHDFLLKLEQSLDNEELLKSYLWLMNNRNEMAMSRMIMKGDLEPIERWYEYPESELPEWVRRQLEEQTGRTVSTDNKKRHQSKAEFRDKGLANDLATQFTLLDTHNVEGSESQERQAIALKNALIEHHHQKESSAEGTSTADSDSAYHETFTFGVEYSRKQFARQRRMGSVFNYFITRLLSRNYDPRTLTLKDLSNESYLGYLYPLNNYLLESKPEINLSYHPQLTLYPISVQCDLEATSEEKKQALVYKTDYINRQGQNNWWVKSSEGNDAWKKELGNVKVYIVMIPSELTHLTIALDSEEAKTIRFDIPNRSDSSQGFIGHDVFTHSDNTMTPSQVSLNTNVELNKFNMVLTPFLYSKELLSIFSGKARLNLSKIPVIAEVENIADPLSQGDLQGSLGTVAISDSVIKKIDFGASSSGGAHAMICAQIECPTAPVARTPREGEYRFKAPGFQSVVMDEEQSAHIIGTVCEMAPTIKGGNGEIYRITLSGDVQNQEYVVRKTSYRKHELELLPKLKNSNVISLLAAIWGEITDSGGIKIYYLLPSYSCNLFHEIDRLEGQCVLSALRQIETHSNVRTLGGADANFKNFLKGILKGLDYLHFNHIVHGDVKLSNVLIRGLCGQCTNFLTCDCDIRAEAVLTDFDASRRLDQKNGWPLRWQKNWPDGDPELWGNSEAMKAFRILFRSGTLSANAPEINRYRKSRNDAILPISQSDPELVRRFWQSSDIYSLGIAIRLAVWGGGVPEPDLRNNWFDSCSGLYGQVCDDECQAQYKAMISVDPSTEGEGFVKKFDQFMEQILYDTTQCRADLRPTATDILGTLNY